MNLRFWHFLVTRMQVSPRNRIPGHGPCKVMFKPDTHAQTHTHWLDNVKRQKTEGGLSELHSSVGKAEDTVVPSLFLYLQPVRVCVSVCVLYVLRS